MSKSNPKDINPIVISGDKYFQNLNQFLALVLSHIRKYQQPHLSSTSGIRKYHEEIIIQLLEKFFFQNPALKPYLMWFYAHFMVEVGNLTLAKEAARIYLEVSKRVADDGKRLLDLSLCFDGIRVMNRIGEMTDQAANLNIMQQLGRLSEKPILCLPNSQAEIGNQALLPYLEDCFEVYKGEKANKAFDLAVRFRPLTLYFYKFSDRQYGHNGQFLSDCYPDLVNAGVNLTPFKLKDITAEKAKVFLSQFGLKQGDEFIVLHLREHGSADGIQHDLRNTNISQYITTIEYLLDIGLKVIRIGNAKMTEIFERPGFIDLTQVERPGEVDIFLSASAKFYFGSGSGPLAVAQAFGTPCCLTNMTYEGIKPNDFCQFLKFKKIGDKQTLKISKIEDLGLFGISSIIPYQKLKLTPQFSTSDQNLQLIKEMIEYLDKGTIYNENKNFKAYKNQLNIRGGLTSDSLLMMQ